MLIRLPWEVDFAAFAERNMLVDFPGPGAIRWDLYDPGTGERIAGAGIYPYDLVNYPGFYYSSSSMLEGFLPLVSPYHVVASYGAELFFKTQWQSIAYGLGLPSFYGYADNPEQIMEYAAPVLEAPEPMIVSVSNSHFHRKNGPYIGTREDVWELESWETPDENTPVLLQWHINVLGLAPWKEKFAAVERLAKIWIDPDVESSDIWSDYSMEWWREIRRRQLEEEGISIEEEEERIRKIFDR